MGKYTKLAKEIIQNAGGKDNVNSVTHCITRLRFKLNDESLADDEKMKNTDGVVSVLHSAGQYQVVIGNEVADVYEEVCRQTGKGAAPEKAETKGEKKSGGALVLDFIINVIMPCINVLCASGMIKGVLSILSFFGWLPMDSGLYQILYACGDALFYFFPVLLGYTTAKKLGMEPFVGLVIGAALVYPSIQYVDLEVFGLTVNTSYTGTMLPVIFTVLFANLIYKPLQKKVPAVIRGFFVPMITMLIAMPVGFIVIGPVMNLISGALGGAIMASYNFSPILAGILVGGLYLVMVIFGIHGALGAIAMMQAAAGEPSFYGLMLGTSFATTATVFAIWLKTKDEKLKELSIPAMISGIFGITEPAIYGVTLPRIKFFVISCIGSALSGAYLGATDCLMWMMTGLGVFAIPGFIGGERSPGTILLNVVIALVIGMAFSFAATYILYKDKDSNDTDRTNGTGDKTQALPEDEEKERKEELYSPMKGFVKPLAEAQDDAFAEGVLGDGVVIVPDNGRICAPADGVVSTLFPTLHAIGLTTDKGAEILIHVGIDTVQMEGKGFTAHVKQGDTVQRGQLLLEADLQKIGEAGFCTETPVIVTNSGDMKQIMKYEGRSVSSGDRLMELYM